MAQDAARVRLAIISESNASGLADLLTVELSKQANLQLLERDQIEKVYREQGLSGAIKDHVRLGQVLGADGLLLLNNAEQAAGVNASPAGQMPSGLGAPSKPVVFNARLVAVKLGVVLAAERFEVERDRSTEWVGSYARRLLPILPKLAVPVKNAVPVSVVNFRSAVASAEAPELERQLQTLAIQRLSRESQLFVLERQKLQQVGAEKGLSADETEFWSGAWLLEGVADQNTYSRSTLTLSVKLSPAKGGSAVQFEVNGSRTNLAEVINALAAKVVAALQINATTEEWNAADEAAQFCAEAKWALLWGAIDQAQTAADAAWALGKRDLEVALLRGRAYVAGVNAGLTPYATLKSHLSPGFNAQGVPVSAPPSEAEIQAHIRETLAEHAWGGFYKKGPKDQHGGVVIDFVFATGLPSPHNIEQARRTLELYLEFCRTSPEGQPKVVTRGPGWNDWRNSDWYQLGIDELVAASKVLQNFYYAPRLDASVAAQLVELRALARLVATTMTESPSVREGYFVGARIATHDELARTMMEGATIFSCLAEWGCFWQERPEDALALYRKLMESPVFCYFHSVFWNRGVLHPRLVGWNERDRQRLPRLWDDFTRELSGSTNVLWQLEAQALARADAPDEASVKKAEQEWWGIVRSNRAALVGNNVELFYRGWQFSPNAETEEMNREYWNQTIPAFKFQVAFEAQKKFLREYQAYEFQNVVEVFRPKAYSQQQALEILPLIAAYKSNLLVQVQQADGVQKSRLQGGVRFVESSLERAVEKLAYPEANAAAPPPVKLANTPAPRPARPADPIAAPEKTHDASTNIILVKKFLEIPVGALSPDTLTAIQINAHRMVAGRLLLDLQLGRAIYSRDAGGNWESTRYAAIPAIAILDTASERWQVIEGAETDTSGQNSFYHRTTFWRDSVFTSQGGKVQRYDLAAKAWVNLDLPNVGNCSLFVVNDRLYAATGDLIAEILEGGADLRILASSRRQPRASVLDAERFGTPFLFASSGGALGVGLALKIFSGDGTDWKEVSAGLQRPGIPRISADGLLLVGDGWDSAVGVWHFSANGDRLKYWLGPHQSVARRTANPALQSTPRWHLPSERTPALHPVATRGSDLLLLVDHAKAENILNEDRVIIGTRVLPQDGYHASLLYFSSNYAEPQQLQLRFNDSGAVLPVSGRVSRGPMLPGFSTPWLCVLGKSLYLGSEAFNSPLTGARVGNLPKLGVWVVSLEQLDPEIARQRQAQDARLAQVAGETQQASQSLLATIDRNRDGQIDAEERQSALTNKDYVASRLSEIDADQNGWIDAGELAFFDVNTNKVLDVNEELGFEQALELLATKLIRDFDSDKNGLLHLREFNDLVQSSPASRTLTMSHFFDENRDGRFDVEEIRAVCRFQLGAGLSARPFATPMMAGRVSGSDAKQRFKAQVDQFWQTGGTNAVPLQKRPGNTQPTGTLPAKPK